MADFLSCDVYSSIFKRHIERKLMEINMNYEPKKKVISFHQPDFRKSIFKIDKLKCLSESEKSKELFVENKYVSNDINIPTQKSCMAESVLLFSESPPMDLDESFMSSSSDENSDSLCRHQMFIDWFLSSVIEGELIEKANEMLFSNRISVVINGDHLLLLDITNKKEIEIRSKQSWIIIYLICKCPTIYIYTFSGKLLIKFMIDACVTDLRFEFADLYRVLGFLTDHPIVDLQLACKFVYPDKCCETVSTMKRFVGNVEELADTRFDSQQLDEFHDCLMEKLRIQNAIDIYMCISCVTNVSLAALEYFGIDVDMAKWEQFRLGVTSTLEDVENEISRITGSALCLSSPAHLKEIVYNKLRLHECLTEQQWQQIGMDNLIRTRSTNEVILSRMIAFHPLPQLLIKYRQINKTKSIYVDSFTAFIDRKKKIISGTWDQNSCVTGRIYCSRPNLQAFPRHQLCTNNGSVSLNVKSIFLSTSDYVMVSADYAHIELRLYTHLANDERLIDLFRSTDAEGCIEADLFTNLSCLLGLQSSSLTNNNDARQTTKQVIYACLYGIGSKGLAEILGISLNQATSMINVVKDFLPKLEVFSNTCFKQVEQNNYSTTITGRRRYFEIQTNTDFIQKMQLKRQIMSYIIQGSAADICKLTMINCQREIGYKNIDARLILSRHDELVWRVKNIYLIELIDIIYKTMNTGLLCYKLPSRIESIDLRVPLKVKVKKGPSLISMEIIEHLTK